MTQRKIIYLCALLYALIIGFSFLFTKVALGVSNPIDTLAYRFTISFLFILIPVAAGWVQLGLHGKKVWRLLLIGLFYPAMFFAFQAFGLVYASSSEGGIIQASSPIFTMVLAAFFLKERTTWLQKLSVLASVGGVVYILMMKGASLNVANTKGMALLLLSSLMLAVYSVLARSLSKEFTALQITFAMMALGFICFNAMSIINHATQGTLPELLEPIKDRSFVVAILYIGILSSLVSALLSNYVLSKIEASQMSVFVNVGTLVSILAGVVFLNEQLAYYHIIGAVFIIGGVLGVNYRGRKRQTQKGKISA
ncbi:Permease of the drug/metabolite transporter (DMT) superfamily [Paenibacillus tianmuensis]|uniref:Permease of the drug/metabolite transporter (DMT) superfamily n=1 Tax=Paenibacillus tianmuensis TaxID=624147 RepID=A0A1G4Q681_9BACL|nr:DMT family transporter [Paenibacillus tianmuensis]SCW40110.1 Permease of the drug/metabolite transporter (DMT) superfamily [Paenibacillus tianmuensis]